MEKGTGRDQKHSLLFLCNRSHWAYSLHCHENICELNCDYTAVKDHNHQITLAQKTRKWYKHLWFRSSLLHIITDSITVSSLTSIHSSCSRCKWNQKRTAKGKSGCRGAPLMTSSYNCVLKKSVLAWQVLFTRCLYQFTPEKFMKISVRAARKSIFDAHSLIFKRDCSLETEPGQCTAR